MNDLHIFNYNGNEVRTVETNGETWWALKDICGILDIANHKDLPKRLEEDEVGRFEFPHPQNVDKSIELVCVNESGLYNVILRSDKPQAKPFRKWVTSEVLPSIRKNGMYATDELIANPDLAIAAFTALKEEREKRAALETTIAVQEQQISELKPKASYYDMVLNCSDLLSATEIAKDYGKSAKWLNKLLQEQGVQFKQRGIWLLYQKYAELGYTSTRTDPYNGKDGTIHTKPHTYWTQKGRLFIYDLLKSIGILPTIEREVENA
jgi:prophage antirepressor-like protein